MRDLDVVVMRSDRALDHWVERLCKCIWSMSIRRRYTSIYVYTSSRVLGIAYSEHFEDCRVFSGKVTVGIVYYTVRCFVVVQPLW